MNEFVYLKTDSGISNIIYADSIVQTKAPTPGLENIYIDPNDCFYDAIASNIQQFKLTDISDKTTYKLSGTITASPGQIYANKIYIQDQSGGLMINLPNEFTTDLNLGENVKVCGYHAEYYLEDEIEVSDGTSIIKLDSSSQINPVSTESVSKQLVGTLVSINGLISENGSSTITVQTSIDQIKVKLSHLTLTQEKSKDDQVIITGVLTRYGDSKDGSAYYRLVPRTTKDIVIVPSDKANDTATKNKSTKSNGKSSTGSTSKIKGATTAKNTTEIGLIPPIFQEKRQSTPPEAGIERTPKEKDQTSLRVVAASGFLISSSSLFMILDPQWKRNIQE